MIENKIEWRDFPCDTGTGPVKTAFMDGSAWVSVAEMAKLFGRAERTIYDHIDEVIKAKDEKFLKISTRKIRIELDKLVRDVVHYDLKFVTRVGYRVHSEQGELFQDWCDEHLNNVVTKGFSVDETRLDADELARQALFAKVREIRTSDREAYRKITDVVATSYDYDPASPVVRGMFAHLQNLVHFAVHGNTAAELVVARADESQPNMGLRTWRGKNVTKADVKVAKNYLQPQELSMMQRLAEGCMLDAECLCEFGRAMSMQDWMDLLEGKMRLLGFPLLVGRGKVSAKEAEKKATKVYTSWKANKKVKVS